VPPDARDGWHVLPLTNHASSAFFNVSSRTIDARRREGFFLLDQVGKGSRLAGSALVQSDSSTTLARVVLQGARAVSTASKPTSSAMPAFDWRLDSSQVAAVLTYIRNRWGNAASTTTNDSIASQRSSLAKAP
jgi:hypothetical protein